MPDSKKTPTQKIELPTQLCGRHVSQKLSAHPNCTTNIKEIRKQNFPCDSTDASTRLHSHTIRALVANESNLDKIPTCGGEESGEVFTGTVSFFGVVIIFARSPNRNIPSSPDWLRTGISFRLKGRIIRSFLDCVLLVLCLFWARFCHCLREVAGSTSTA